MWAFKLACVYFIALLHGCTAFATALSLDGPAEIVTAADHVEPDTALHGGAVEAVLADLGLSPLGRA